MTKVKGQGHKYSFSVGAQGLTNLYIVSQLVINSNARDRVDTKLNPRVNVHVQMDRLPKKTTSIKTGFSEENYVPQTIFYPWC